MALDLSVPVPSTVICRNTGEVRASLPSLPYPVVIKPSRSRVRTPHGWISHRVEYAADGADLLARVDRLPRSAFPVLLQERISGPGVGFFVCYDRGSPIAFFAHRRIREKPATGGVSVLCESLEMPADALEYGCRLLDRLGWHGVAMVEFKENTDDGSLRLMEINARFWGSLQLAIHSGVDFPRILVDVARGASAGPSPTYLPGIRSRWFLGDVDSLIGVMLSKGRDQSAIADAGGRWRAMTDFLAIGGKSARHDVMSLADPRPGLLELRRWFFQR